VVSPTSLLVPPLPYFSQRDSGLVWTNPRHRGHPERL